MEISQQSTDIATEMPRVTSGAIRVANAEDESQQSVTPVTSAAATQLISLNTEVEKEGVSQVTIIPLSTEKGEELERTTFSSSTKLESSATLTPAFEKGVGEVTATGNDFLLPTHSAQTSTDLEPAVATLSPTGNLYETTVTPERSDEEIMTKGSTKTPERNIENSAEQSSLGGEETSTVYSVHSTENREPLTQLTSESETVQKTASVTASQALPEEIMTQKPEDSSDQTTLAANLDSVTEISSVTEEEGSGQETTVLAEATQGIRYNKEDIPPVFVEGAPVPSPSPLPGSGLKSTAKTITHQGTEGTVENASTSSPSKADLFTISNAPVSEVSAENLATTAAYAMGSDDNFGSGESPGTEAPGTLLTTESEVLNEGKKLETAVEEIVNASLAADEHERNIETIEKSLVSEIDNQTREMDAEMEKTRKAESSTTEPTTEEIGSETTEFTKEPLASGVTAINIGVTSSGEKYEGTTHSLETTETKDSVPEGTEPQQEGEVKQLAEVETTEMPYSTTYLQKSIKKHGGY